MSNPNPKTIQESITNAGFVVESDGRDGFNVTRETTGEDGEATVVESFVVLPTVGEGQAWAIVPKTLVTNRACGFEATVDVATIASDGLAFLLEYGFDQKLGDTVNSAFARDKDKAKARLAGHSMLKDIIAGTMRSGGGGGSPMTPELKARRLALDVLLSAVTLPDGVTVAKLARDLDKAVVALGGDPTVARESIETTTAVFLTAELSARKLAAVRRVAEHPETVAAIES